MSAIVRSSHYFRFGLGLFHQLVGAGVVYGWPAMQSVLEREGVYGGLCPGEPISKCNKATIKFNEIFNAGSFAATGGGIVFGMLFDRLGPRVSTIVGHAMMIGAVLMFAFSSSKLDMFIPSYFVMGLAGAPIQLAVLPSSNEFENPATGMALNTCVFSGAALIFSLFEVISKHGYSHKSIFLVYALVLACNMVTGILFIPPTSVSAKSEEDGDAHEPLMVDDESRGHHSFVKEGDGASSVDGLMSPADLRAAVNNQPIADTNRHSTVKQHLLHASLKGQILNRAFVLAALFAVINVLSINFYIGTASKQLARMGDKHNTHADQFSTMLIFGALTVPFTGPIFKALGLVKTIILFESLMLLYFIPAMVSNLGLQYMTFVVVSIVRPFSFATMFNCVNMLFGARHFGTLLGTISTLAGVISLLQTPLLSIVLDYCDGNFLPVNAGLAACTVPIVALCLHMISYLDRPLRTPKLVKAYSGITSLLHRHVPVQESPLGLGELSIQS